MWNIRHGKMFREKTGDIRDTAARARWAVEAIKKKT